jgi:hypothetical protein
VVASELSEKWDYEFFVEGYKYEAVDGAKDRNRAYWDFEVVS